jgi:methionine sulfoxide reductase heme-binding subunit
VTAPVPAASRAGGQDQAPRAAPWTPPRWLAPLVVLAALAPALWLSGALASDFLRNTRFLGADPIETLEHGSGIWALRFVVLTLAITPLRRLTGANWLARYRRRIGLVAFTYAALHLLTYVALDIQLYWPQLLEDFTKRPYIIVGMLAFTLLLALAVTSTAGWIKRLGKRWTQLHQLVYVAAVLGVVHFWMSVKLDITEPLVFAGLLVALLGYRAWHTRRSSSALRASSPSSTPSSSASA